MEYTILHRIFLSRRKQRYVSELTPLFIRPSFWKTHSKSRLVDNLPSAIFIVQNSHLFVIRFLIFRIDRTGNQFTRISESDLLLLLLEMLYSIKVWLFLFKSYTPIVLTEIHFSLSSIKSIWNIRSSFESDQQLQQLLIPIDWIMQFLFRIV